MNEASDILANFLENYPPSSYTVLNIIKSANEYSVRIPNIKLYCSHDDCQGIRIFEPDTRKVGIYRNQSRNEFLEYTCKNCESKRKFFSLHFANYDEDEIQVIKFGELPPFGPIIPSQLLDLLNDDVELFKKGSNCENQGQGIGAFSYYRRVLDNQKNKLIEEMIKVAQSIGADKDFIESLEEARKETGFKNSVDKIKKVIPDGFKLDGHNPLTLLNTALSKGLHARTDKECLEIAKDIRIIFQHLATKLHELSTDDKELKEAITNLTQFSTPKS